ncbi:MAG: carboxypeptidase regulatory-like domain-containing protein, partial [Deltaproteobacteria bacterium]|nr:carboxypeptidase regulatory-like domain-containing protein [Deltaproteobacteria bacterium]
MKTTRFFLSALAALAIAVAGCSTSVDPTNPFDPEAAEGKKAKGSIFGKVDLERSSDESGALVSLSGTSLTAVTEASGEFSLTNVQSGVYTVTVTKEGFRQEKVGGVSVKVGGRTEVGEIFVLVGRGVVSGQVVMPEAMDNGGAVVSVVPASGTSDSRLTTDGSGLAPCASRLSPFESDLQSTAYSLQSGSASFGAITGADGTFEIGNVPVGQYFLIVNKEGYQAACMALVTIVADGEEKKLGVMELASTSGLVKFADGDGLELVAYKEDGAVRYFTNRKDLKALLHASGAVRMRMGWSEAEVDAAAFETFSVEKDVPLPGTETDGEKTLYVDLRDQCGMERRYEAKLSLDTVGPETAAAEVEGVEGLDGKKYVKTADGQATVRLSAGDEGSGISGYRLTVDEEPADEAWTAMPGSGNVVVGLGTAEKEYGVHVEYVDRAGNTAEAPVATVTLDYRPPVVGDPAVVVQNGTDVGGKQTVTDEYVTFAFNVSEGAAQYRLGDASGGGSWQDFAATASIGLAGRQRGDISQFVRFRDNAKNETQEYVVSYAYETQGSVRGNVKLEGGGDPTGVSVLINAAGASAVHPDANGDYSILGVERGSYTVKFSATGHDEAQQVVVVKAGVESTLSGIELRRSRGVLKGTFTLAGATSHGGTNVKVAEAGLTVETNTDGSFELNNLVAQQYTLTAGKYGYVSVSGQVVTVPAGGEGVAAGGELQVSLSASITGTATCDVGSCGSANISFNGTRFDGVAASANATANADGTFSLSSLAAGTYTVGAQKDGYGAASTSVKLEPGEAADSGQIELRASRGSVKGVVTAGGTNAAGAQVTLSGTSAIGVAVSQTVLTDASGSFRFDGVLAGSYTATAGLKDYNNQAKNVDVAAGVETDAGTFALAINPGSISGKVALEGGADPGSVQVIVVAQGVSPVVPDGTGAYTVGNLAAGSYTVRYTMAGYDEGQQLVVVEAGKTAAVPDVALKKSRGGLSGKFALAGATNHGGVTVRIVGAGLSVETAADGTWAITNLVAQQYTVNASRTGYVSATNLPATVPAGGTGTVAETQLQIDLTASISGTVVCDVGNCGSANIALAGTRFDGQGITQNGTANADGTYTLNNLPAGDYAVTATKGGY